MVLWLAVWVWSIDFSARGTSCTPQVVQPPPACCPCCPPQGRVAWLTREIACHALQWTCLHVHRIGQDKWRKSAATH